MQFLALAELGILLYLIFYLRLLLFGETLEIGGKALGRGPVKSEHIV